jgi:DNA-binding SARP family transcriptional activator
MLRLTLLGAPTLTCDGSAIVLPIRRSIALLIALARHPSPLPRSRIASLLWPDIDEPTARRNLRRELGRLREIAADAVAVEGDALRLGDRVTVDAVEFEGAVAAGRVDDALALWHGPLASDFALGDADAFDAWLERERAGLAERRRDALRRSATALEAAGQRAAALDRIETLLADDPLQEQHHRDAMRLLAALGRREAALARYDACKAVLRDELGLVPMAETDALARSVRSGSDQAGARPPPLASSQEPGTATLGGASVAGSRPAPASRALLPEPLPFVGRDAEFAALESAWTAGRAIIVVGEGGIGKSRLAIDFAAAHGAYALSRCRPGDAGVPYAAFARGLRALLGGDTPSLPEGLPAWVASEVARLVPEIGPALPALRTDEERARFFEACARAWQALAADDFDTVVVDDWHHADPASRGLLAYVMRRRNEAGVRGAREIVVLREELDEAARADLDDLIAGSRSELVRLRQLSDADVFEMVRRLSRAEAPTQFAHRLCRATGGNAFFLAATLRHLADTGLLTADADGAWQTPYDESTADYAEIPVPASVHEAVLARARRLGPQARRVLEAASLASEPFAPAHLAPACALSELEAVLAIEDGVTAGLLQEHATGGYAFSHDLVQQSLAAQLGDERRRLVHRRLALGAEAAGAPPATIAAHHEASGDRVRAVAHRTAAGDEALRLRALPEAIAQWQKALADGASPAQALRLHERISQAAFERLDVALAGAQAEAIGRLLDAASLDDEDRLTAAVWRGAALSCAGRSAEALAALDALPREPSGRLRVRVLLTRARAHDDLGHAESTALAIEAALAEKAATDADRLQVLHCAFVNEFISGREAAALVHADAAMALARRLGDSGGIARGHTSRGMVLYSTGDLAGSEIALRAAADQAGEHGLVRYERVALCNLITVHGAQGRYADALAAAQRGWNLQPPLEAGDYFHISFRLARVDAWFGLGDIGAAWSDAGPAVEEALAHPDPRMRIGAATCILELLGMIGETGLADRLIDRLHDEADGSLKAIADEMWVVIAQYELQRSDVAAAARAMARLDATGEVVAARVKVRAAQARVQLLLAQGEAAQALQGLPADDAVGMNDEMRMRGVALRVAAEAASGQLRPETECVAETIVEAAPGHAIAKLEVSAALSMAAAPRRGAGSARDAHRARVATMASTLQSMPLQQAAFEAWWATAGRSRAVPSPLPASDPPVLP